MRALLLLGGALAFMPPPAPAPSSRRFSAAPGLTPASAVTRLKVAAQTKQVPVNELIECLACVEEQAAAQDAATLSSRMQSQLTGCWRLVYMSARSDPYCPGNLVLTLDTTAQTGEVDEIQAAQTLEGFRKELPELRDLSFDTISGAQGNGAFAHYRVSEATNLKLAEGSLYLVDSGGQYPDGTTDITRTVPIGDPTAEMRTQFTRVLKGHIALSMIRFPKGTTGTQLDVLARMPLWMAGFDYDHGTGHGVGSFLGVHEGPQRISKAPNSVPLEPGMIVSNEPGYYKADGYGIRIENLQFVTDPSVPEGGDREMLGFETLTVAPIHRALIDTHLLTPDELQWLDAYHRMVRERVLPFVQGEVADWLLKATEPLLGATP